MIHKIGAGIFYIILFGVWFYTNTDDYGSRFGETDPAWVMAMVFGGLCGITLVLSSLEEAIKNKSLKFLEWEAFLLTPALLWFIYMIFTH
jgi:hypothetical protein